MPHGAKEEERLTCSDLSVGSLFGVYLANDNSASKCKKVCCSCGPFVSSYKRTTCDCYARSKSTRVVAKSSGVVSSVSL